MTVDEAIAMVRAEPNGLADMFYYMKAGRRLASEVEQLRIRLDSMTATADRILKQSAERIATATCDRRVN